jgi:hypothetical protein
MKDFIEHIQKSIYAPVYYRDIVTRPASYSWKYYGSLAMFLAVLMTIVASVPLVPRLNTFLTTLPTSVIAYYPSDLQMIITRGQVATNVSEPYFLKLPSGEATSTLASSSSVFSLGVIDTKSEVTLSRFNEYHALFWITRDSLVSLDRAGGLQVTKLGDITITIDVEHLRSFVRGIEPYFVWVSPVVVFVIFVGMLLSFLVMLVYLLLDALFVFVLGRILKQYWSYRDAYHICLHAVTLPLLCSSIFYLLPVSGIQLPFLSTLLLLVVVYFNFRDISHNISELNKEG